MDGPWYEVSGPDATKVRNDVRALLTGRFDKEQLEEHLTRVIPDEGKDFGSWRGYVTFRVAQSIADEVERSLVQAQ